MFKRRKTKWIVLQCYHVGGTDYILLARKNIRTGMIYVKTKRATPTLSCSYLFKREFMSIDVRFKMLLEL